MNSLKQYAIMLIVWVIAFSSNIGHADDSNIVIPDGTQIPIELITKVSSKNTFVGEVFDFGVLEDIVVADTTVIAKGARVYTIVKNVKPAGDWGKSGAIELEPKFVTSVNGVQIPLTTKINRSETDHSPVGVLPGAILGASTLGRAGGLGSILLFADPRKGNQAELPEKTKFIVTVNGDKDLEASSTKLKSKLSAQSKYRQFDWEGKWDLPQGVLILTRSGDIVKGRMEHGTGTLVGTIVDNQLVGQWYGRLFNPMDDNGQFRFQMAVDGNHFTNKWFSETANAWITDITARKIIE